MEKELVQIGFTDAEAKIYRAVLKLGVCTVKQISKESGFHRTNIYDVLEQLKEKGLITYFKEGKSVKYRASNPENIHAYMDEKIEILNQIMPELKKLQEQKGEFIEVEVFKGEEGMKAVLRDIIKENKPMYGFGIKGQLRDKLPVYAEQWLSRMKAQKTPYYGIYTEKDNLPGYYTEVRFVSSELSSPVATFIYGNKVNINIWEPSLIAITIKSEIVSSMYKKHFDLLWKLAKKK
jgi:sugar-specific transcriptional regulator TrmB